MNGDRSAREPDGRLGAILGTLLFFVAAPGSAAGLAPYLLTRWKVQAPFLGVIGARVAGALLLAGGVVALIECFGRFALVGRGTPAPVAPPRELVVSGLYRRVRNPMYVAVVATILGQALFLGQVVLLQYAAAVWAIVHVWLLVYEEPSLRRRFGPSYQEYCSNVRRWWPRTTPWRPRDEPIRAAATAGTTPGSGA